MGAHTITCKIKRNCFQLYFCWFVVVVVFSVLLSLFFKIFGFVSFGTITLHIPHNFVSCKTFPTTNLLDEGSTQPGNGSKNNNKNTRTEEESERKNVFQFSTTEIYRDKVKKHHIRKAHIQHRITVGLAQTFLEMYERKQWQQHHSQK